MSKGSIFRIIASFVSCFLEIFGIFFKRPENKDEDEHNPVGKGPFLCGGFLMAVLDNGRRWNGIEIASLFNRKIKEWTGRCDLGGDELTGR